VAGGAQGGAEATSRALPGDRRRVSCKDPRDGDANGDVATPHGLLLDEEWRFTVCNDIFKHLNVWKKKINLI
jgi:hypothetical protein